MEFREMHEAVIAAYRRRDYAFCFALVDDFIAKVSGFDLGRAFSLKAAIIMQVTIGRATEGLSLLDEALVLVEEAPRETLNILVNALSLCYRTGDVERSAIYEVKAARLLQQNQADETLNGIRHRLHLNLGLIAALREDHATALWHFMQGSAVLNRVEADDDTHCLIFLLDLYAAESCLSMGRLPEAHEHLRLAQGHIVSNSQRIQWTIAMSEVLRASGRSTEAISLLESLGKPDHQVWPPDNVTRFYLAWAKTAIATDNIRDYNRYMTLAQSEAIEHSLDYLLCQIQRLQRAPLKMGVVR